MIEYGLRVLLAGALVFLGGWLGIPPFEYAWKLGVALGALALVGHFLDGRGKLNPGIAGFFAIGEAAIIALTLALSGRLSSFGFLVLVPVILATVRKGASAASMAPLASSCILAAWALTSAKPIPNATILLQMAAVLGISLLAGSGAPKIVEVPTFVPDDESLALRENLRQLEDVHKNLERKSARANLLADLEEARHGGDAFFERLASAIQKATGITSVGVYSLAQFDDVMVVRGVAGNYGDQLQDASVSVTLRQAREAITEKALQTLTALKSGVDGRTIANVLLSDRGRIIGMIALAAQDAYTANEGRQRLEEVATPLCQWVLEFQRREAWRRRAQQAEVLYDLASINSGASSAEALCDRIITDLWEIIDADHVAIWRIQNEDATPVSRRGVPTDLMSSMSFAQGAGVLGWLRTGAPELAMFDVRSDDRCRANEALRQRIGSFFCAPILVDGRAFGFITLATHRAGALDVTDLETVRLVATEMARALARIADPEARNEGLMTPLEFRAHVSGKPGVLVLLEALKRVALVDTYGRPAMQHAYRQYATRIRAKLPTGGAICRKGEGGFVVFLPDATDDFATGWANDAAATASMIGLRTPDGSTRIPLAMRAKVAHMTQQDSGFLDPQPA